MESKDLMVLYGILGNFMSFKLRVLIGFHHNPKKFLRVCGQNPKWYKKNMEFSL